MTIEGAVLIHNRPLGSKESLRDRFRGALLGTAVGDALGAPVEGRREVPESYLASLESNPPALAYTDGTAMTIGVARSLISNAGFDEERMANTLAETYRREPWRGYGPVHGTGWGLDTTAGSKSC